MQLIHDHQAIMTSVKEVNHTIFAKDPSSDQLDVKERRSSNASLLLMNPINEDLVRSGLSAISVKHGNHRNSFRCLHRPDLKRVPYLRRLTPDELELLFRGSSDKIKTKSRKS
ncbi:hypothetical protein MSG28_011197 [Choristoneura fumiferana]|uniref:Uncharacterized protein n=1 Tax=Choristoneura fumiferana TaxID=7141 RepID=A0ACC0KRB9_CHOFU|nr:hypothetical protein MSG28_011197 [Choristoneura fumiferana]